MRQYSGMGDADESNRRYRFLLAQGSEGLSVAFDLPTQMGYDSDHPRAEGEVGKVGVAIDSLADMRLLLADLPLDKVTTSMTINATAAILLLFYQLVAEENGVDPKALGGTIQNDILKEYVARGTYIYPPRPSMRLVTDTFSYCAENLPAWNTISISGYHIREAGSTAVQEIAFTIANGIAYVDAALAAGLDVDAFAPRLSFFWNAHNNLFEEVAKYRAARRMWAKIMTERFKAKNEKSTLLRFHTQTGGSTLTAQQPENNIVRVTVQALAAALGGTQSLHTNGFDEALGLPTEKAAKIALRTQQIVGYESGIADTVDPLAGSYYVESLTDEVEAGAWDYLERIDGMGGAVDAIEAQFMQQEIEQAAYAYAKAIDDNEKIVIGVNKFADATNEPNDVFPIDVELQRSQIASVKKVRADRDQAAVDAALSDIEAAARGTQNLLVPMKEALGSMATLGEVSDVLRGVFGEFRPGG
jgi:methylmalonyl-CoA mutase N-terminal domain/subunit